jgi:hypothetical protein
VIEKYVRDVAMESIVLNQIAGRSGAADAVELADEVEKSDKTLKMFSSCQIVCHRGEVFVQQQGKRRLVLLIKATNAYLIRDLQERRLRALDDDPVPFT